MASTNGESNRAPRIAQDGGTNVDGKSAATETGTFLGEFPYVRFGSGPENLVILPGLTLENEPPNRLAAWTYRLGFGRFAKDYTVYVINRRRGMPSGYTTRDMAADYAAVLDQEIGPSHLMGFSTGGEIAQYVAIDHPASVRSLILVVSACRLSEDGARDLRALADAGARGTLARAADGHGLRRGERRDEQTPREGCSWGCSGGSSSRCHPTRRTFLTTLEADLVHDTTGRLGEISAPSLIIGGSEDPFFSEEPPARDRRKDTRCDPAPLRWRRARSTERAQASLRTGRACVPGRPSWKIVR